MSVGGGEREGRELLSVSVGRGESTAMASHARPHVPVSVGRGESTAMASHARPHLPVSAF